MSLGRILIDGYNLLHIWQEIAKGKDRFCETSRDELIKILIKYNDATGIPITIFFDGSSEDRVKEKESGNKKVEVVYSTKGSSADKLIERAAMKLAQHMEIMVVTDDYVQRDVVTAAGALVSSCENFIRTVYSELKETAKIIKKHNLCERTGFRNNIPI